MVVCQDGFSRSVRLAVNHSEDSDSTGSITGNILGALLGNWAMPWEWLERVEMQ
ncbi:MAG: ADP-ribosylglycohydrolase family protein [Geobacter sp.]|nr:MAG: ADP-ribosylglycohydrolase family protein [Geobacter sp.]